MSMLKETGCLIWEVKSRLIGQVWLCERMPPTAFNSVLFDNFP